MALVVVVAAYIAFLICCGGILRGKTRRVQPRAVVGHDIISTIVVVVVEIDRITHTDNALDGIVVQTSHLYQGMQRVILGRQVLTYDMLAGCHRHQFIQRIGVALRRQHTVLIIQYKLIRPAVQTRSPALLRLRFQRFRLARSRRTVAIDAPAKCVCKTSQIYSKWHRGAVAHTHRIPVCHLGVGIFVFLTLIPTLVLPRYIVRRRHRRIARGHEHRVQTRHRIE